MKLKLERSRIDAGRIGEYCLQMDKQKVLKAVFQALEEELLDSLSQRAFAGDI